MRSSRFRLAVGALVALVAAVVLIAVFARAPQQPAAQAPLERSLSVYAAAGLLNAEVLASRSATATLETWCRDHGLAQPPTVVATRVTTVDKPPTEQQRAELKVGADEPVRYRNVRLSCGERLLSEAENWYVPSRLTAEMNQILDSSDTPFGKVVAALTPTRTTLDMQILWEVLPQGWENLPRQELRQWAARHQDIVGHDEGRDMFRHVAVLTRESDDLPIAEVFETYQMGALRFLAGR